MRARYYGLPGLLLTLQLALAPALAANNPFEPRAPKIPKASEATPKRQAPQTASSSGRKMNKAPSSSSTTPARRIAPVKAEFTLQSGTFLEKTVKNLPSLTQMADAALDPYLIIDEAATAAGLSGGMNLLKRSNIFLFMVQDDDTLPAAERAAMYTALHRIDTLDEVYQNSGVADRTLVRDYVTSHIKGSEAATFAWLMLQEPAIMKIIKLIHDDAPRNQPIMPSVILDQMLANYGITTLEQYLAAQNSGISLDTVIKATDPTAALSDQQKNPDAKSITEEVQKAGGQSGYGKETGQSGVQQSDAGIDMKAGLHKGGFGAFTSCMQDYFDMQQAGGNLGGPLGGGPKSDCGPGGCGPSGGGMGGKAGGFGNAKINNGGGKSSPNSCAGVDLSNFLNTASDGDNSGDGAKGGDAPKAPYSDEYSKVYQEVRDNNKNVDTSNGYTIQTGIGGGAYSAATTYSATVTPDSGDMGYTVTYTTSTATTNDGGKTWVEGSTQSTTLHDQSGADIHAHFVADLNNAAHRITNSLWGFNGPSKAGASAVVTADGVVKSSTTYFGGGYMPTPDQADSAGICSPQTLGNATASCLGLGGGSGGLPSCSSFRDSRVCKQADCGMALTGDGMLSLGGNGGAGGNDGGGSGVSATPCHYDESGNQICPQQKVCQPDGGSAEFLKMLPSAMLVDPRPEAQPFSFGSNIDTLNQISFSSSKAQQPIGQQSGEKNKKGIQQQVGGGGGEKSPAGAAPTDLLGGKPKTGTGGGAPVPKPGK